MKECKALLSKNSRMRSGGILSSMGMYKKGGSLPRGLCLVICRGGYWESLVGGNLVAHVTGSLSLRERYAGWCL